MKQRYIEKDWTEEKGNHATIPIDIEFTKAGTVTPTKENLDSLMGDVEEHNAEKGPILFLISLVIGMVLILMGNSYCVLTGTLVCVSACGFVCSWVFFSAVFSHNETNSFSGTPEVSE